MRSTGSGAARARASCSIRAAIEAQNAKLQQLDKSVHDVEAMPRTLAATDVRTWIEHMSSRPADTLYDEKGQAGPG